MTTEMIRVFQSREEELASLEERPGFPPGMLSVVFHPAYPFGSGHCAGWEFSTMTDDADEYFIPGEPNDDESDLIERALQWLSELEISRFLDAFYEAQD